MSAWVGLAALVVQTVVWIVIGTWIIGRALGVERVERERSFADIENDLRDQITSSSREHRQTVESVARLIGNDINALRDRLHEHEITTRETFVRRDSFYKVADELKALFAKLDAKIDRLQEARWGRDPR